ncbi:MAG TPA: tetratricopeptide repeat protein [Terriglobia bacterium]|nr:tetratricopeptide repeat protein [Terriglobia bacterium]
MNGLYIRLAGLVLTFALLGVGAGCRLVSAQTNSTGGSAARATSLLEQAEQLLQAGSVEEAQEKAVQGLKFQPRSAEGLNLLGLIYESEKKYELSAESFKNALKIAPHSTEIHNNLGNTYLLEHKFEDAEKEFRAILSLHPSNRDANYNLGVALLAQHRPKEAIRYLQRVQPPSLSTQINLVQAYLVAGETKQGLHTASRLSATNNDDVQLHFTLGVLLAANGQYEAGARELEIADVLRPGTFEILYNLGQAYMGSGKTDRAEEVLSRALKLRSDSDQVLYFLAKAYSNQSQDGKALDVLSRAHQIAPRNTDVIFLMARLSMRQSFFEDAIPLLEQGVKVAPRRPDLHAALGECYFTTGKIPQALEEFQTLIDLDPSGRSYAFMALYYRHMGRFEKAKKYLTLGLKVDPNNSSCLYNMGYILSRQGDYAEAEKWLQKAIAADPQNGDALFELAGVKMSERKFQEAVPLLQKCTRQALHPVRAYYKLATAERNLHQTAAAERDLKIFQTLSKNQTSGPYPFQHLFDYLDRRAGMPSQEKSQLDLQQLTQEIKLHPDQPRYLYLLAEGYLKLGKVDDARQAVARLDQLSQGDFRTAVGVGVLLARYHLYTEAISHFKRALDTNPESDDAWYDLADAYLGKHDCPDAFNALQHVSPEGQKDSTYRALLADVDARLGHVQEAIRLYQQLTVENPDKDRAYLSLALAYLRARETQQARQTLEQGLARIPDSGELFWGMGVISAIEGRLPQAENYLKRSVELLPEWPAGYSALGVLYYQTGQMDKVRRTLNDFIKNGPRGALNVSRIEQALAAAPAQSPTQNPPTVLPPQARQQFLQTALALAEE